MAEGWANHLHGDTIEASSAGIEIRAFIAALPGSLE